MMPIRFVGKIFTVRPMDGRKEGPGPELQVVDRLFLDPII